MGGKNTEPIKQMFLSRSFNIKRDWEKAKQLEGNMGSKEMCFFFLIINKGAITRCLTLTAHQARRNGAQWQLQMEQGWEGR